MWIKLFLLVFVCVCIRVQSFFPFWSKSSYKHESLRHWMWFSWWSIFCHQIYRDVFRLHRQVCASSLYLSTSLLCLCISSLCLSRSSCLLQYVFLYFTIMSLYFINNIPFYFISISFYFMITLCLFSFGMFLAHVNLVHPYCY